MKIRARHYGHDGERTAIDIIDPSDGAVSHSIELTDGEEVTIVATTADSPADIEVGEVGPIADSAPAEDAPDTEASAADAGAADGEGLGGDNTASTAEGAEETASGSGKGRGPVNGEPGPDAA